MALYREIVYVCKFIWLCVGPRLDLDPDIVAAMDDDFDFDEPDNVLEDDFIFVANAKTTCDVVSPLEE